MIFDTSTKKGARAVARLGEETLGWLTTAFPDGRLASSLVWFLWHDGEILVYSRNTAKVGNISANPNVAFNLNSDDHGGSVLTIQGTARIDSAYPASDQIPEYQTKYVDLIAGLGMTPPEFANDYSVPVRVTPTNYRSF